MNVTRLALVTLALAGCGGMRTAVLGPSKAQQEADELAIAAEDVCRTAITATATSSLRFLRGAGREFEDLAAQAEQKDPDVWKREQPIAGRPRAEIRARCPAQITDALAAAEQREADRVATGEQAKAKKEARKAELRALLEGDRLRIFEAHGEPFKFDGAIENGAWWRYGISYSDGGEEVDCTVTYTFRGDKVAKKELARSCPNDPHPGIAAK